MGKLTYNGVRKEAGATVDSQQLQEMRITRKKSLRASLYQGGRGISDSHSGRWVESSTENNNNNNNVNDQQLREMRATRRKSLSETLLRGGRGISDSHSGRW